MNCRRQVRVCISWDRLPTTKKMQRLTDICDEKFKTEDNSKQTDECFLLAASKRNTTATARKPCAGVCVALVSGHVDCKTYTDAVCSTCDDRCCLGVVPLPLPFHATQDERKALGVLMRVVQHVCWIVARSRGPFGVVPRSFPLSGHRELIARSCFLLQSSMD